MEFNSLQYIVFLFVMLCLYQVNNHKFRMVLLLTGSYYFYGCWNAKYTALIAGVTLISYIAPIIMEKFEKYKKAILAIAITICILLIFYFKYFNFVFGIINNTILRNSGFSVKTLDVILPVGISFFTFQAISYMIDVYKGSCILEKNIVYYALYISFFPQLVAGPIERASNILGQLKQKYTFDIEKAQTGVWMIIWGLFKKMVIADRLAVYVDLVYSDVHSYTGFSLVLATIMFAFQIYCDFSAYSEIAIGSARLFGIKLMTNFKIPYFADSLADFWNRWHISLSTWLRDYIYIPLGGNRKGKINTYFNLFATFVISGIWHGANITYILWRGLAD